MHERHDRLTRFRQRIDIPPAARIAVALAVGASAAFALAGLGAAAALLGGWAAAGSCFVVWALLVIVPMDATATREHAVREDPTRTASDAIVLLAAVASLGGVGVVLAEGGLQQNLATSATALAAIVVSWAATHTLFALRYARSYFAEPVGGIDFHQPEPPCYTDFTYLAVTVGMSFAVSDTDLGASALRRIAQVHALLAYLFGTVIVALLVNLLAGLANG